jgi:DNA-binding NarL/FixJ family response regulator
MTTLPVSTHQPVRSAPRGKEALLVVDHHPVVFEGFRHIADKVGITHVLKAGNIDAGYDLFRKQKPRLVITDLYFEDDGLSGLTLIHRMRASNPAAQILVYSMQDDPVIVAHALRVGAGGFVVKNASIATLLEALTEVRAGRGYLPHAIATTVATLNLSEKPDPLASLTAREIQILSLIGQGKSYTDIIGILSISYRVLTNMLHAIRTKIKAKNHFELIQFTLSQRSLNIAFLSSKTVN